MKAIQNLKRKIHGNFIENASRLQLNAIEELNIYQDIYQLEVITSQRHVTKDFFNYCKNKESFLLLLLYNNEGKVYLKQSGDNKFCLPGGEINEDTTIFDSVKRITTSIKNDISINELEPLAFIENSFIFEGNTIKHTGIVMMARVNIERKDTAYKRFFTVSDQILENINVFSNRKILKFFIKRFFSIMKQTNGQFQDEEIETNKKYKLRYKFHNMFVKRFILTPKLKKTAKLKTLIKRKLKNSSKLIDVSCGDNSLLFSLLDTGNIDYMVANDISWSQIELIPKMSKVIFTNHNAISFPFKDNVFDFVYCSNTLYHISNEENLQNLLKSLLRIGKKIVIYEIENPEVTRGFPYILNKYWYRGFLKDVGEQYLSYERFKQIITDSYKGKAKIKFEIFRNIQGNYMIAEIEKT